MAAYIADVKKGEMVLMIGDNQVLVTDKALVARIARTYASHAQA